MDRAAGSVSEPNASSDESEILDALDRQDSRDALNRLMELYGHAVFRFCRQLTGDETLADECRQITFVQAYEGLPRFSRRSSLKTWLFSIARHRCLDALKSRRRRFARFLPMPEHDVGSAGTVADKALAKDRLRGLAECLAGLNAKVRAAVLLRFQEDLSYGQMAEVCDERPATLQARVARALPVLRQCLKRREHAP